MLKFLRKFSKNPDFSTFWSFWYIKCYHTVHCKNGFIPKTDQNCDFTWLKMAQVKSKSNKPNLKSIPKSPEAQFHEKTPTHTYAYYKCYLRNYNFLSNFPESDSQGFRSKFLYHEIQHHSLNQKPCLDQKKYRKKMYSVIFIKILFIYEIMGSFLTTFDHF